jgi:hypothetical protein
VIERDVQRYKRLVELRAIESEAKWRPLAAYQQCCKTELPRISRAGCTTANPLEVNASLAWVRCPQEIGTVLRHSSIAKAASAIAIDAEKFACGIWRQGLKLKNRRLGQ